MGKGGRFIAFLLVILLAVGCENSGRKQEDLGAPVKTLRFLVSAHLSKALLDQADRFADDVERLSEGELRVDVRIGVSDQDTVSLGGCDFTYLRNIQLSQLDTAFSMLALPFLYNDGAHMSAALNSQELQERWTALLSPYGIQPMACVYNGSAMLVTTQGALRVASDFEGLTIAMRTDSAEKLEIFTALGAKVLPYQENSLAGKLGERVEILLENNIPLDVTIDTVEVTAEQALGILENPEVLSAIQTGHTISPLWLVINKQTWESLNDKEKAVLSEACAGLVAGLEQERRQEDNRLMDDLIAQGMTVMGVERRRIAASLYGKSGEGEGKFVLPDYFDKALYQIIQEYA